MATFQKQCPTCGGTQTYSSQKVHRKAIREGWQCKSCATESSHFRSPRAFFKTDDYKDKMSVALKEARKTDSYGEAFKQKCRENKLEQISKMGVPTAFNVNACSFIDRINSMFGWNLQHALSGGEVKVVGYSLDGYDKFRNIVFEYDEPKHRTKYCKNKDRERDSRIIQAINPSEFWRYDEVTQTLKDVLSGKEIVCLNL